MCIRDSFLAQVTGRKYGGSTGTNLYGVFQLAAEMIVKGEAGSIVTLACDPGDRYLNTYYDRDWLKQNNHRIEPYLQQMREFYQAGEWTCVPPVSYTHLTLPT